MRLTLITLFFVSFNLSIAQLSNPIKKSNLILSKYGIQTPDPYSWMEDMRSTEVINWVNAQNIITDSVHQKIKKSVSVKETIKLFNENSSGSFPVVDGRYFYKLLTLNLKKSPSLFLFKNLQDQPLEIINPNKIYPEKNVNIENFSASKKSYYLAYTLRINGSDKLEMRFWDLIKNKSVTDTLKNIKFSSIAWNKDNGVFYKKNSNKSVFAKDSTYQLYYHRMNSLQEEDVVIYDAAKSESYLTHFTSKDKLFVILTNKEETKSDYFYADLDNPSFTLVKFADHLKDNFNFINFFNGRVYYSTNQYNWGEVKSFDLKNPNDEKQIIPQIYNHLLEKVFFTNDFLICKYRSSGKNYFIFYTYEGKLVKKIDVPENVSLSYLNFVEESKDFYFSATSYTLPIRNFKVNLESGNINQVFSSVNIAKPSLFPLDYFETKYTYFTSPENLQIPITIVYKKGLKLDGNNPCLLEAYGGFGVISKPHYDTALLHFLDKGGVFAFAEIRGGGEKGKDWHKKGKGLHKVDGLNDFIGASEFLIKEKYTNPSKLGITGASQGGLVVGYALVQRPDLYKIAIPKVGVFDMLNANKFTVGKYHLDEYGNPEIEDEYKSLLNYSPLHHIQEDVNYPTTLIITSDNDDRVPPFHSYKFAAALQNRKAQKNPIFLRVKKDLGHFGGNTYEKFVEEQAEFYDFLMYYLMKS